MSSMASDAESLRACPYGFCCRDMLQLKASISANDCPNLQSCKSLAKSGGMRDDLPVEGWETETFPITLVQDGAEQEVEWTRREAAIHMLARRGAPQSLDDMAAPQLLTRLSQKIDALHQALETLADEYIAPDQARMHAYHVYRPSRPELRAAGLPESELTRDRIRQYQNQFTYNKLTSREAIFGPVIKETLVKAIHLSRDSDARSVEGAKGIERRNRIHHIATLLGNAEALMQEALRVATDD